MNLIEDFKNFLASFTGLTARLEEVSKNLSSALESLDAVKSENADLKAKLDAAPTAEALKAAEDLAASEKARADAAEAKQADFDQKVAEAANKKAAEAVAANGHDPVSTVQSKEKEGAKPDFSNLSGLEKAIAAHKASKSNLNK